MNKLHETALALAARGKRPFIIASLLHRILGVEHLSKGELVSFSSLPTLMREASGKSKHTVKGRFARNRLVDIYADLGVDELCICVVRAFKVRLVGMQGGRVVSCTLPRSLFPTPPPNSTSSFFGVSASPSQCPLSSPCLLHPPLDLRGRFHFPCVLFTPLPNFPLYPCPIP